MQRRTLLKALVPAALFPTTVINGRTAAAIAHMPKGEYFLFYDQQMIDSHWIDEVCSQETPEGFDAAVTFFPVRVRHGEKLEDAIKIYRLEHTNEEQQDEKPNNLNLGEALGIVKRS